MEIRTGSAAVAAVLRQHRERLGLTLEEASARLGAYGHPMLGSVVSKLERGHRRIDVDDLLAFASVYGVPVGSLFDNIEPVVDVETLVGDLVTLNYELDELLSETNVRVAVLRESEETRWRTIFDHAAAHGTASVEQVIAASAGDNADVLLERLHAELPKVEAHVENQEGHPQGR